MCEAFWQAKIWGLLHDPPLKALYDRKSEEGTLQFLTCMNGWVFPKKDLKNTQFSNEWLNHIGLCDYIASASDRAAIGRLPPTTQVNYTNDGIQIRHLLSGEPQTLKLGQWHDNLMELGRERTTWLANVETSLIPDKIKQETDARKVFWWLWRCYPEVLSNALNRDNKIPNEPRLPLLPAETRIPDGSLWSHATMTSALAGSLAGYYNNAADYPQKNARNWHKSRPHVATFTFSPVQEVIKASRKMRDFWAGSWLLHYLSAKICWNIAWKYGPDTLLYPCLYAQPLIDLWLLEKYPCFKEWINQPSPKDYRRLLTAGFPNVLVMILPDNGVSPSARGDDIPGTVKNPVEAAMQQAEQTLREEWRDLGGLVLDDLQGKNERWMPNLNRRTWDGWLESQWQTYWVALPLGDRTAELHQSPGKENEENYEEWEKTQNKFACPKKDLFVQPEKEFLKAVYEYVSKRTEENPPNLNVGSWWASIFDQTRLSLNAVKNIRTWKIPTAFGPRSTISGIGPVVHPVYDSQKPDWATEGQTANHWSEDNHQGLFDGIEELNATEVLKRGLHRILPGVLSISQSEQFEWYYPDLTSGVAGWLRQMEREGNEGAIAYYQDVCNQVCSEYNWSRQGRNAAANQPWGIPWVQKHHPNWLNPRLLDAGWLIEDYHPQSPNLEQKREKIQDKKRELRDFIAQRFRPGNNPTDWYVLAVGDGDGMGEWLKGVPLKNYSDYIPDALTPKLDNLPEELQQPFNTFLTEQKRMGPATHSALSRALLDFSNQLVPYLTEERYAGRLIYGGGDDVLAYTNLWEWDSWLWDIRQCFRGQKDPRNEFEASGDYWHWHESTENKRPESIADRPLFTMGHKASISFGLVIAHHSVPLAIALENLWEAEKDAKKHEYHSNGRLKNKKSCHAKKDAVQIRVLYGNGNILKTTAKFEVFHLWQQLLAPQRNDNNHFQPESSLFEQAAQLYSQHPIPVPEAIAPWTQAFCTRRENLADAQNQQAFQGCLHDFLHEIWRTNLKAEDASQPEHKREKQRRKAENQRDLDVQNWLKLAAFVIRNRDIKWEKQP